MGYWVDLNDPYITYKNEYMETLWWILSELYKKGWLYKGYTVQPYSPKSGTGLSSHELNQPGTYKMVKDTTVTGQFHLKNDQQHPLMPLLFEDQNEDTAILAWTTTPMDAAIKLRAGRGRGYRLCKDPHFQPVYF